VHQLTISEIPILLPDLKINIEAITMKKIIFLPFTILLLLLTQTLYSQGYSSIQIDSLVNKAMFISPSAGVAVVVVKDDKVVHI
jgi:membrane-associated PAP2 superfamily phosphatase